MRVYQGTNGAQVANLCQIVMILSRLLVKCYISLLRIANVL
jgi:hypothetical protein